MSFLGHYRSGLHCKQLAASYIIFHFKEIWNQPVVWRQHHCNLSLLQQFVRAMKAQFLLCWTLLLSVVSANEPQNGPTDHPGLARQWTGQHKGVSAAPNCADTDPNCPAWAFTGECTINPRYMLTACRKSCKQCAAPNFLLTLAREIAAIKLLLSKTTTTDGLIN